MPVRIRKGMGPGILNSKDKKKLRNSSYQSRHEHVKEIVKAIEEDTFKDEEDKPNQTLAGK